jgi:hypothetical protein
MALSDTAHRILAEAAQHQLRLATPPDKLPATACRAVLNSLLKQGYVEACAAPVEHIGLGWRQQDGALTVMRITDAGMSAIGAAAGDNTAADEAELGGLTEAEPEMAQRALDARIDLSAPVAAEELGSGPLAAPAPPEATVPPAGAEGAQQPSTAAPARPSLSDAVNCVLAAWDTPEQLSLAAAIAALRAALPVRTSRPPRQPGTPRQPRQGTKQEAVLALLRRPEGATVAQIAEATGWASHTVRGFFAGLKKRGMTVTVLERVRQVGPDKQGAKGSYSIYRIAEAG